MLVNRFSNQAMHNTGLDRVQLRAGQIIQGKVLNLYPGQHATIQVGSQKWQAQLKAPLAKGGHYHFKVEQAGSPFILKVVGQALGKQPIQNIHALLDQLGFASSKQRTDFLADVIKSQIPFGKEQLAQAFGLLEAAGYRKEAQVAVKTMMADRLPFIDNILAAVQTKNTSTLSQEFQTLTQHLRQQRTQGTMGMLLNRMQWLMDARNPSPSEVIRQIIDGVSQNNPDFFQLLKTSGTIDPTLDFDTWKNEWSQFMKVHNWNQSTVNLLLNRTRLPFAINPEEMAASIKQLRENTIPQSVQDVIRSWEGVVKNVISQNTRLPNETFEELQQNLQQASTQLSLPQQNRLNSLLSNQPEGLQALQAYLEALVHQQKMISSPNLTIQERFLAHIDTTLSHIGLAHESLLARDTQEIEASIKSLLIQLVQQQDQTMSERAQPLLNLINGLQIDSVRETSFLVQAALQLPGEKIGLHEDILLEFNGRKRKNGTIDPSDCSILFHLNLAHLNETVIDMHIQKRTVALTIWNEQSVHPDLAESFKPALKAGLESLDYHLTHINFKQITDRSDRRPETGSSAQTFPETTYEGVDLRI
ncbi:hypothetical protein JNUCC1_03864 [Lentibacillus sp. JNUCC-1]|uniref:hypothetical protein n=1 Tax=Lentibacillus sp. JNUCC-1 TaxID=2654513 RepID=UPI0012E6F45E|nr:hypothetical protein [Lentibacillus sp. JNUCC-1]MUV39980.1 hypothetical protein [Lentibacillus sp. JNUCC-1]